jgi:hypothetical protein
VIRATFSVNLNDVRRKIGDKVLVVQKKVALQCLEGIVNMTPVDTGRARGNWQVTIGSPKQGHDWERKDKGGSATIDQGRSTVNELSSPGTVYITNNLPYILALENGRSSTQAPQGMVRLTLDRIGLQFKVT